MSNIIVFNSTHKGASHYKNGKPCQDYSLSYQSDDESLYVSIVCDGHGGDTYVRSDRGSRLAAEITLQAIKEFVENVDVGLFIDKSGEVTARPEDDDPLFSLSRNKKSIHDQDLTESERDLLMQNESFYKQIRDIKEHDKVFTSLFACIYDRWLDAIQNDAKDDPFTDAESAALGNLKLKAPQKAYGSTLIAFVRTPLYWFGFQIGDGKCISCDRNLNWKEPIPWDCNCFLNMTTSLCNSNPIPAFRYSFNGTGNFPSAVIMGSDGLDDSWVTMQNLQNFYTQIIHLFVEVGYENTMKELDDYLPKLSAKGSRDDMSVAGIVNMEAIKEGVRIFKLKKEYDILVAEKQKRDEAQNVLQNKENVIRKSLHELDAEIANSKQEADRLWKKLLKQKDDRDIRIKEMQTKQRLQLKEMAEISKELEEIKEMNDQENDISENKTKKIIEERNILKEQNLLSEQEESEAWHRLKRQYEEQKLLLQDGNRKAQSESMQNSSDEWLRGLDCVDIAAAKCGQMENDDIKGNEDIGQ